MILPLGGLEKGKGERETTTADTKHIYASVRGVVEHLLDPAVQPVGVEPPLEQLRLDGRGGGGAGGEGRRQERRGDLLSI